VTTPAQGDIWLLEPPNGKRRPVLVVTRNEAIPVVTNLVVAPITSTIRAIPTAIPVGPSEGIDHESVASFDNLAAVPRSLLTRRLGRLDSTRHPEICAALEALADC
jgi:mRNA interferase MazF